jgi:OmpA-OmpF porin, OOP family
MTTKLFIAGIAILLPVVANATAIKQRPYGYSFDVASAAASDVFVVCEDSPDDRISVLPAPPQLAVRLSRSEVRIDSPKNTSLSEAVSKKECVPCLLGSVHFQFDSAVLTQKERTKLDQLIGDIPAGTGVKLDGYTCDLGNTSHNLSLSLRRAREVASYLRGKNVAVGDVEGKGKCCQVSDDRRLNRRVEITTQKREEK